MSNFNNHEFVVKRIGIAVAAEDTLLTTIEAARYLGISTQYFYHLVSEGKLPRYKLGPRATRFKVADLERFLEQRRIASSDEYSRLVRGIGRLETETREHQEAVYE